MQKMQEMQEIEKLMQEGEKWYDIFSALDAEYMTSIFAGRRQGVSDERERLQAMSNANDAHQRVIVAVGNLDGASAEGQALYHQSREVLHRLRSLPQETERERHEFLSIIRRTAQQATEAAQKVAEKILEKA